MYKNATYKEKFADLKEWIPYLVESVKKDLRNEHLKNDMYFVKKFLASKNIHKATTEELAQAYDKAIQEEEHGEDLAEFITTRWLLKNSELYEFFEKQLSQIHPDFASLEEITPPQAQIVIEAANREFGAPQTYLFSVLNSVVFPAESFEKLKAKAKDQQVKQEEESLREEEQLSVEQMRREFERENARLTDKYEKKLAGLHKKYLADTEALKKQLAALQRKIHQEKGH
jgi:hypothetical protein